MQAQPIIGRRRKRKRTSLFCTRERVLEGMRAAAITVWAGEEQQLPACTKDYQAAVNEVEPLPRKGALRRLYPSPSSILAFFASLTDAWAALGYTVHARAHVTAAEIETQIKEQVYERPRLSNRPRGLAVRIEPVPENTIKRNPTTGRLASQGGVTVSRLADLPSEGFCVQCDATKPIAKMLVVHMRKEKLYRLRPRCKDCHNKRERGHRREWKREYLRQWRANNKSLDRSYWKNDPDRKTKTRLAMALRHSGELHHALLIQGRLRRQLGLKISTAEAEALLRKFGPCYPSKYGLTPEGLRAVERLRSTMRRNHKEYKVVELRVIVYEQGLFIAPDQQTPPYQHAARTLSNLQRTKRQKDLVGKAA